MADLIKPVAEELWIAETPLRFVVQAGRRMAVIRLRGRELFIHSPAELTPGLRRALDALGEVRYVVPASRLHGHLFMEQYSAAYPEAVLYAAPGLQRRRPDLSFNGQLGDAPDPQWEGEIDQALLRCGRFLTEALFCHRRSRTLLVGDAVWNVTPSMPLGARVWAGWRTRVAPTPAFRLAMRDREAARTAIQRVLNWDFDRIVIGHGEMVENGGKETLRRAYAWLLRDATPKPA